MNKMYLWNIGLINIPDEIDRIFSDDGKYLVSPTLQGNHFFEMSGESMYYALKDIEIKTGQNTIEQRERIVYSIKKRIIACGGYLYHESLSSGIADTQLRSTSSAIRILIEGLIDGFDVKEDLVNLANYHFKFFFNWKDGIWFCHDTSEWKKRGPKTHIKSRRMKKDFQNTLTLNTHFDSLSTLLLLRRECPSLNFEFSIDEYITKGNKCIISLFEADDSHNKLNIILQNLDNIILRKAIASKMFPFRIYERIIHPLLFKLFSPTVFFNYGFISRDLAVMNRHLDYMIVNMVDITRYSILAKSTGVELKIISQKLLEKIKQGVKFIDNTKEYQSFLYSKELSIAWLCELSVLLDTLSLGYSFNVESYHYPKYSPFTLNK